jgi:hypothetical protein
MEINRKVRKTKRKFTMGAFNEGRIVAVLQITIFFDRDAKAILDGVHELGRLFK